MRIQRLARPLLGPSVTRLWLSVTAFEILGDEAAPAVPALLKLAAKWESDRKLIGVEMALVHMGNSGSTCLVSIITNDRVPIRQRVNAAELLALPSGTPSTNLTWAIPALARCSGESQLSKPILGTLASLAGQSPTAIAKLLEACSSTDAMTREGATNALRLVAPERLPRPQ